MLRKKILITYFPNKARKKPDLDQQQDKTTAGSDQTTTTLTCLTKLEQPDLKRELLFSMRKSYWFIKNVIMNR